MDPGNFINKAISHTPDVEIHTRPKLCHFGRYLIKAKLFCVNLRFVTVTGLECSYGKIFIPVTEISVTGPARPLTWTHRYFYKEKSGEARSWKPSQPGRPGSYEEAPSVRCRGEREPANEALPALQYGIDVNCDPMSSRVLRLLACSCVDHTSRFIRFSLQKTIQSQTLEGFLPRSKGKSVI